MFLAILLAQNFVVVVHKRKSLKEKKKKKILDDPPVSRIGKPPLRSAVYNNPFFPLSL